MPRPRTARPGIRATRRRVAASCWLESPQARHLHLKHLRASSLARNGIPASAAYGTHKSCPALMLGLLSALADMISWTTLRGSAVGSAAAARDHSV
jgi:hypothetical protein